jgi:hypothetical protein
VTDEGGSPSSQCIAGLGIPVFQSIRQSAILTTSFPIGSHIVVTLLLSRKYQPIVVDNFHNSKPKAIQACEEIAREALG